MGRRQVSTQKKLFFDTIQEMRQMVTAHRGGYTKDVMGLNKKNTKTPYNHLMGRRDKLHQRHANEKQRAREETIQYDSSMKLLNSQVMEMRKEKDTFERNQYKFTDVNSGKVGRERDGFLHISAKDLDRINGKQPKEGKQQAAKSGKKIFKGKNKQKKQKRHNKLR